MWTKKQADAYRDAYPSMSFKQVRATMSRVLTTYHQLSGPPLTLLELIMYWKLRGLRILELGGYDGFHALAVLTSYRDFSWTNVEISPVAEARTKPGLQDLKYQCRVLDRWFWEWPLDEAYDVFYSSKMLEHLSLDQVVKTLDHTQDIPYHVHVIDFFHQEDTHVLPLGAYREVEQWYLSHGFDANFGEYYGNQAMIQLRIIASKREVPA